MPPNQPTNLWEYFQGQGRPLPQTAAERFADPNFAAAAGRAGFNPQNYQVNLENASANQSILAELLKGGQPPPPITTSGEVRQKVNQNVDYLNQNLGLLEGIDEKAAKKEAAFDSQLAAFTKQLDDLSARSNAATKNLLRGINADYAQRQVEAADQNDRYQQGLKVLGLQTGTTKFLPFIQQGMLTFAEMEGQKELSRLDGEGKKLLAEAQQAQIDQDFRIVSEKMEAYRENEAMKSRSINDLYDQAQSRQSIQANAMKLGASIAPFLVKELAGLSEIQKQEILQRIAKEYGVAVNDLLVGLSSYEQERSDIDREFNLDQSRERRLASEGTGGGGSTVVRGETGPAYKDWWPGFLASAEGKEIAQRIARENPGTNDNIPIAKEFRRIYAERFGGQGGERQVNPNKNYSAATIPDNIRNELMDDIESGLSIPELLRYYPDVSTSYLNSLFKQLGGSSAGGGYQVPDESL